MNKNTKILMLGKSTLYSIGHGHKTMEEFIAELQEFGIKYLIDVRSSPYSKWAPHFNQGIIENWLHQNNVRYVYMGDVIGGRPIDDSYYDDNGYFDYKKMAEAPQFKEGLKRLITANNKGILIAIMCSESDPSQCHRSKLIGRELYFTYDINMNHIINKGACISQTKIMIELTNQRWLPEGNLFGSCDPPYFKSRKAYKEETSDIETAYE